LGYTPTVFWLKGFIPTMFVSSPVMLSPFKVTNYLYCDAGPLSDLPMFASIVLPLYCHLSFIHMHSCMHSLHTDIIHTWLHCQFYFNCTESVIRNVIHKCYQSSIFQVAGPTKTTLLQVYSHFPSFFPSLVIISVKVIGSISFRMLVVTPVKVIDDISFRMLSLPQ